ncbi:MAG: AAA family ATPase, partial [Desulfovibrionales bacterium]
MLEFLRIRNLALIQDMELEFHSGLNVLTGESGAGKSFILRALDFILGDKLGPELVRPDQDKASVEAIFVLEDEEIVLRRELTASSGRSRVFVNDGLSSQERIRELKPRLVIHTSQHAQQRLLKPGYHTSILDSSLPAEVLRTRSTCLEGLRGVVKRKESLQEKAAGLAEKRDYLEYQHKEIARVDPLPGEEEELEARRRQLQNQSQAQESLQRSLDLLHGPEEGLYDRVVALEKSLHGLVEAGHDLGGQAEALEGCRHVLSELDRDLRRLPLLQDWEKELEK